MRNALLPPVSSQLYNLGNNGVQMPNLDVSMSVDREVNVHGTNIYLHTTSNQLRGRDFTIPFQTLVNYQPAGYQSSFSGDNMSLQSMLQSRKVSVPEVDMDFQVTQMRKRPIQYTSLTDSGDLIENKTTLRELQTNKKKKGNVSAEEHWDTHDPKLRLPVRRSQKLSDKITALQKLVSPYGKTDTASVLQEASLYIKLLQQQIQNLFQMLSSSYDTTRPIQHSEEIHTKLEDLRSRGLCLVPISLTQRMTRNDHGIDSNVVEGKLF
ncbi:hypothetical protein Tsubulata_018089 [Turnera subulata]|uniref:BHLH domain-containing protein n=1 Tax=Turnera subulata TaxID=218843 RepID=A0A9Q0FFH7_9ROSI|nr:hypothetical protein Tsubulata_018089 [Turnera subulata]